MRRLTFRLVVSLWLMTASALVLQWRTVSADLSVTTSGTEAARFGLLDAGEYYACGVNAGDIMCWGFATFNDRFNVPTTVTVGGAPFSVDTVIDLDVGGTYFDDGATACIVGNDGAVVGGVWCWGGNFYGQFGNGNSSTWQETYNEPVRAFGNLTGATRVAVGQNHVCVLKSDSTVLCTGQNTSGQLGDGSFNSSTSPRTVTTGGSALSGVTALSAGLSTTCAISSGDTWCWGDASKYQLGNASSNASNIAVASYNQPGSTAIEVQGTAVCTIGSYGMQCWGETTRNGSNLTNTERLGTASGTGEVWVPSPVTAINFTPTAMAMSLTHTCVLNSAGEVWCYGNNDNGMLGNGLTIDSAVGVKVNLPEPVNVIAAGIISTCAVNHAGAMWCWGDGTNFSLANGSSANRSTPNPVTTRGFNWTYMGVAPTTTTTTTTLAPTTTTLAPTTTTLATTTTVTVAPAAPTTTTAPGSGAAGGASTNPQSSIRNLPATGTQSIHVLVLWAALVILTGLVIATRPTPRR